MNLFEDPYEGIDSRADSIRSSAAMIYNTIFLVFTIGVCKIREIFQQIYVF